MKALRIFLFALLATAALSAYPCNLDNPHLKTLKEKGVTVFDQSQQSSDICLTDWGINQTCCDSAKVLEWNASQRALLSTLANSAIAEIKVLVDGIVQEVIQPLSLTPIQKALLIKPEEEARITAFAEYLASPNLVSVQATCMTRISKFRASAVCNTCSGKSSLYFEGDKLSISTQTCRLIVTDCMASWKDLVHLITEMDFAFRLAVEIKRAQGGNPNIKLDNDDSEKLKKWVDDHGVKGVLQSCADPNIPSQCPDSSLSKLCTKLVTITGPVPLKKVNKMTKTIARIGKVGKIISRPILKALKALKTVIKALAKVLGKLGKGISKLFSGLAKKIGSVVKKLRLMGKKMLGGLKKLGSHMKKAISKALAPFKAGFRKVTKKISQSVRAAAKSVKSFAKKVSSKIGKACSKSKKSVQKSVKSICVKSKSVVKNFASKLQLGKKSKKTKTPQTSNQSSSSGRGSSSSSSGRGRSSRGRKLFSLGSSDQVVVGRCMENCGGETPVEA